MKKIIWSVCLLAVLDVSSALANPVTALIRVATESRRVGRVPVRTPPAQIPRSFQAEKTWGTLNRADMILSYRPRSAGNVSVERSMGGLKFEIWLDSGVSLRDYRTMFDGWSDGAVPRQNFDAAMLYGLNNYKTNVRRILDNNGIDSERVLPSNVVGYVYDPMTPTSQVMLDFPYHLGVSFNLRESDLRKIDLSVIEEIIEAGARI